MADYSTLKAAITAVIRTNYNEEITGQILQDVLIGVVDALGSGYLLMGVATPATSPGTPDENVAYLAATNGTYTNFGGLTVGDEVALLVWDGSWHKQSLANAFTAAERTKLAGIEAGAQVNPPIDSALSDSSTNPVQNKVITSHITALESQVFARDLSYIDPLTGIQMGVRNTANTYVVRESGKYRIPLVYGNGVKRNVINAAAYTRLDSEYTADFVNHLGNLILSPFIEAHTGCVAASAGLLWQTGTDLIASVDLAAGVDCRYIEFTVNNIPTTNGLAVLYVKDAYGNIMWSWTIWLTTDDLTPQVQTNYQGVDYDMMPENLGAIWNAERTKCVAPHYQWGRKDPMCPPATYNSNINMNLYDIDGNLYAGFGNYGVADDSDGGGTERSVTNSIKMPNKFFLEYDATKYNWNNLEWFNNFWNAAETLSSSLDDNQDTAVKTIYDPSLPGMMLPSGRFATGFTTTGGNTSTAAEFNVVGAFDNGWHFKRRNLDLDGAYYPAAGYRRRTSGSLYDVGSGGCVWTFAPDSQANARLLGFGSGGVNPLNASRRAGGFSVRSSREIN